MSKPSRLAIRLMAFITGINEERPTRLRICKALNRCERSVKSAIAELVKNQWITCVGGGNGTPSKIIVINAIDWIIARDSKPARDLEKVARDSQKTSRDCHRIRVKVKPLEQAPTKSQPDIHSLVVKTLGTWQLGGWWSERTGSWQRPGALADPGTLARIAGALRTPAEWQEFRGGVFEKLQAAETWGLIVEFARECGGVERKPMGVEDSIYRKAAAR
jgi:hypothetical protein